MKPRLLQSHNIIPMLCHLCKKKLVFIVIIIITRRIAGNIIRLYICECNSIVWINIVCNIFSFIK